MKLQYVVAVVIVAVVVAMSIPMLNSPREDFSSYNPEWNGCSRIKEISGESGHPVSALFSAETLQGKDKGAVVLLNPSTQVDMQAEDTATLRSFVHNGGSLLLANDFGNANQVIEGLGLAQTVKFDGSLLYDDANNWGGSVYPEIYRFAPSNVTDGVRTVDLNYATTLDVTPAAGAPQATVLATSARSSYLSTELPNASTSTPTVISSGAKPLLAYIPYGNGRIILFSDPSVFVNGMLDHGDNEKLYTNIIANLTDGDTATPVYFSEAYRAQPPVWSKAYDELSTNDTLKYVAVLGAVGLFVVGMNTNRLLRRKSRRSEALPKVTHDEQAIAEDIAQRHPRWNPTLIKELQRTIRLRTRRRRP